MAKLWGSRFKKESDPLADCFSFSTFYDYRLAGYDIEVSIAHAKMLAKTKIIPQKDAKKIIFGLKKIGSQIEKGQFEVDLKSEDIHSQIQGMLKKIIGAPADKLHTARSRNDLVVQEMKMYCRNEIYAIVDLINNFQKVLVSCADKNKTLIIPAYTHLQPAQVVLLAHHLLAYVQMLERDKERLLENAARLSQSLVLGSAALSGTTLPIDRAFLAKELKFKAPSGNSMDSVSDRDFIIETLSNLSIISMHLSRMAEDLILWASKEFHVADIDWSLCTGSSIMPHKKNPDVLELIRGETATIYGNLNKILVLTKGLPLTYNRDLQLDKPPLFESVEKIILILELMPKVFETIRFHKDTVAERIKDESFFMVDVMEYLIKKGVSYREAHDTIGFMVKECLDKDVAISSLTKTELLSFHPQLKEDVKKLLNAQASVTMKKSFGSTNPSLVNAQIKNWKRNLK